jgi:hypothetical protein
MDKGKTDTICQLDVRDDIFVTTQHFKGEILVHIKSVKAIKVIATCTFLLASVNQSLTRSVFKSQQLYIIK